jgi:hypothetical protein
MLRQRQKVFAALHFGRYWHKASIRGRAANGRFRGKSGHGVRAPVTIDLEYPKGSFPGKIKAGRGCKGDCVHPDAATAIEEIHKV